MQHWCVQPTRLTKVMFSIVLVSAFNVDLLLDHAILWMTFPLLRVFDTSESSTQLLIFQHFSTFFNIFHCDGSFACVKQLPVCDSVAYDPLLRTFFYPPCVWNYYQFMQIGVRRTYTLMVRTRDTCVWKAFAYILNRRGACISYLPSKMAASGGFASSAAAPPPPQKQNPSRLRRTVVA